MPVELSRDNDIFTVTDAELVAGGDPEATLTIRHVSVEKVREFVKKHTEAKWNRGIRTETFNEIGFSDDQLDYALVDWTGFTSEGQPVPCTRENKLRLDGGRRAAIIGRATENRVTPAQARADSFRRPEDVRELVGG